MQLLAGFYEREGARRCDAECFEHFGCKDFANTAFQREPAIAKATERRLARSFCAEVHQPTSIIDCLRKQKSAPVPDIGIVNAELVPVVAERKRLRQRPFQRFEPAEMGNPLSLGQISKSDLRRCTIISPPQDMFGKYRPIDGIRKKIGNLANGIDWGEWLRVCMHAAIWTARVERSTVSYVDSYWWSNDGLRLHYRGYPGPADRPPILCMGGLTRNARDFEGVAERLSPDWRVIAVDFRGRGDSAYAKDAMTYVPITYVQDIERLLSDLRIDRFIALGTSLGGIVTMLLAATGRARLAGALLNDIGPVIEADGLARIKGLVGRNSSWPTWLHAARGLSETHAIIYPGYTIERWLVLAKRMCRLSRQGRIVPDYDINIAEPFRLPGGEAGVDLWPALDALVDVPTLIVRGAFSDVLNEATALEMAERLPAATLVTIDDVGHAPTLDEPEAIAAIDAMLVRIVS